MTTVFLAHGLRMGVGNSAGAGTAQVPSLPTTGAGR